jgi:hypothetical protein
MLRATRPRHEREDDGRAAGDHDGGDLLKVIHAGECGVTR